MISTKGQDQISSQKCQSTGLRENMETALDRFEELATAVTRLQEKLEYVTASYPKGNPTETPPDAGMSQAELVVTDLCKRLETLTVRVGTLTNQVRI